MNLIQAELKGSDTVAIAGEVVPAPLPPAARVVDLQYLRAAGVE